MKITPTSTSLPQPHIHTVQFYDADGSLLDELTSNIGPALTGGCSAVVIATSAHLADLSNKLQSAGINIPLAKEEGRYIALNASEILSQFMGNGWPDSIRFFEVMSGVITCAAKAARHPTRRVVAFGEMVALLWAEGWAESALALEKLWNDLAESYAFELHCAYPLQGFGGSNLTDSLLKICSAHTEIISNELHPEVAKQLTKHSELRHEIALLTRLRQEAIELATLVGMTETGWKEYDHRRERICELTKQLSQLENSNHAQSS